MTKEEKLPLCSGCRNEFYNSGNNTIGVKDCWHLKTAKPVVRWKLGWWTTPDTPGAFRQVNTLSCHYATGRYAFYEKLPDFAVDPVRLERQS